MLALVFSDFCCPVEVSCWPDDACAYSDPLLLPRCEIFSRKTIRWEQLELGHRGWAHLDTNFYSRADLTEVSLEVTFKATSGECTCFEDSPWLSFKHFPFVFLGMMRAWLSQFFLTEEVFLCVENGSCIKKKIVERNLMYAHLMVVFLPPSLSSPHVLLSKAHVQPVFPAAREV